MKRIFLFQILLFFISCGNNIEKEENIEFMSYSWHLNRDKQVYFIKCESYSIISFSGKNKSYFVDFFPNKKTVFFESQLNKKLIDSIVSTVEKMKKNNRTYIDYDSSSGCIEGPPTFKLKVNYANNASKTYFFSYKELAHCKYLNTLYRDVNIAKMAEKYVIISDTSEIATRKNNFISKTIHEDTIKFKKPKIMPSIPQG